MSDVQIVAVITDGFTHVYEQNGSGVLNEKVRVMGEMKPEDALALASLVRGAVIPGSEPSPTLLDELTFSTAPARPVEYLPAPTPFKRHSRIGVQGEIVHLMEFLATQDRPMMAADIVDGIPEWTYDNLKRVLQNAKRYGVIERSGRRWFLTGRSLATSKRASRITSAGPGWENTLEHIRLHPGITRRELHHQLHFATRKDTNNRVLLLKGKGFITEDAGGALRAVPAPDDGARPSGS